MITDNEEREGIIREAALWAIRNYREELGEHLDTSDKVLDEVHLSIVGVEPGPSIWNKYDILVDDEDDEDEDEDEDGVTLTVVLEACGYEWTCPQCGKHQQTDMEIGATVRCGKCGRVCGIVGFITG